MTYLDTHAVVWLYQGDVERFSEPARRQMESDELRVSPAVVLELEYLREVEKLKVPAKRILQTLSEEIGLTVCDLPFAQVVDCACGEKWIRDPFDRLIVGQAKANNAALITKDEAIRRKYPLSVW